MNLSQSRTGLKGLKVSKVMMVLIIIPLLTINLASCASKLKRDLTDNVPKAAALTSSLDLTSISFVNISTGETVVLADYMEGSGTEYLLLTFGSISCGTCTKKAKEISETVIDKHPLLLAESTAFDLVGVNTDAKVSGKVRRQTNDFPFIKWSDASGALMIKHFMPPGRRFSVPLTVLLNRRGILWQLPPDEPVTVSEIMGKVERTLQDLGLSGSDGGSEDGTGHGDGQESGADEGSDDGGDGDGSGEGSSGEDMSEDGGGSTESGDDGADGGQGDGGGPYFLHDVTPDRLKAVDIESCRGDSMNLAEVFAGSHLKVIQVAKGACDTDCRHNVQMLLATKASCQQDPALTLDEGEDPCSVASLSTDLTGDVCATQIAYGGGLEFFSVFASHFNWRYTPLETPDYELFLPEIAGPLIFVFDRSGRLIFSKEGRLQPNELKDRFSRRDGSDGHQYALHPGPNFEFYDRERGNFRFADLRRTAKFTVLSAFGAFPVPCTSCIEELSHWSAPGGAVDFCAGRPKDCQIFAVEASMDPNQVEGGVAAQFDHVINGDGLDFSGFQSLNIRVPLLLDPVSMAEEQGYLYRFFDGYLQAYEPQLGLVYRTVIYDQDGKIVSTFASGDTAEDPVLPVLKALLGE